MAVRRAASQPPLPSRVQQRGRSCPRFGCCPASCRECAADHTRCWEGLSFSLPCPLCGDTNAWQAPGPPRENYFPHDGNLRRARDRRWSQSFPRYWRGAAVWDARPQNPTRLWPRPSVRPSPALSGEALYFNTVNQQLNWCEMRIWKRPQPLRLHKSKVTPPLEEGVRGGSRHASIPGPDVQTLVSTRASTAPPPGVRFCFP